MTKTDFRKLFDDYYNPLCNFAKSILHDSSRAQDAVQDVYVSLWIKRRSLDHSNLKSYLFTSTRNKCIEILRSQALDLKMRTENQRRIEMSSSLIIDEEANKYLLKEKLYNSIRQLPPKCQEVFSLSKLNGLTYSEIADRLDISVKTVENQMGRALRLLREIIADNFYNKK